MATNFTPRNTDELVTLDINDRRRLAVAECLMHSEAGGLFPATLGQVVLRNVVTEDEVNTLGDKVHRRLQVIFGV